MGNSTNDQLSSHADGDTHVDSFQKDHSAVRRTRQNQDMLLSSGLDVIPWKGSCEAMVAQPTSQIFMCKHSPTSQAVPQTGPSCSGRFPSIDVATMEIEGF